MKVCGLSWMEPCNPPKSRTLGLRLVQPVLRGAGEEGAPGGCPLWTLAEGVSLGRHQRSLVLSHESCKKGVIGRGMGFNIPFPSTAPLKPRLSCLSCCGKQLRG